MFGIKRKRPNQSFRFEWKNNMSAPRLNWKQMAESRPTEEQEGSGVVKGLSRRVIVIKSPDARYFDEAIFVLKDEIFSPGKDQAAILKEARRVADGYVRPPVKPPKQKKSSSKFPKHLF